MNQRQSAGRESVQIQVAGDYVVQEGVTEERALEIANEASRHAIALFTSEALGRAAERIDELDQRIVDVFSDLQILDVFTDPGFQRLLKKAQAGAACTDRGSDLDLLVRLLVDRVQNSGSRPTRASVDRAVEIVDQVDDSALTALTVLFSVMQFSPSAARVRDGLDTMETLYSQFEVEHLPSDKEWLDHLDVLGAIRLSQLTSLSNLAHIWMSSAMPGYVCEGFENPSGESPHIVTIIPGFPGVAAIEHELRPGYLRMPFTKEDDFRRQIEAMGGDVATRADEYLEIIRRDFGFGAMHGDCTPRFNAEMDARPSIATVRRWWDAVGTGLSITGVGKALAKANLKRLHKGAPLPGVE